MIEVMGGRIYFQGHKVAAIYKNIPASVRHEFENKIERLNGESEEELEESEFEDE